MEQVTLLAQLSREELYAIYQFLLLESRSPQEIHRNAPKEQMIEILGFVLSLEEAQYCIEFFENYDFYDVPVLKWEMIDALPDDLLCALHSIYLDSIDFPESHQELVDSLSQSNYFLKEDARKFYLWFHYFRERTRWEDTAVARDPVYEDATVRYDLEDLGVASSFTMENYGELIADEAAPSAHSVSYGGGAQTMVGMDSFQDQTTTFMGPQEPMNTMPSQPGLAAVDVDMSVSNTITDAQLSPLQQQLLASLQGQGAGNPVNQTIEINSFNLESYMLENEEAIRQGDKPPSVQQVISEIQKSRSVDTQENEPPPAQSGSVIVEDPSIVVDAPLIERSIQVDTKPPPPPKVTPRSTMILDATAIIMEADTLSGAKRPEVRPEPPRRPPASASGHLGDLRTVDLETGEPLGEDDEAIETLEPIEEDDVVEAAAPPSGHAPANGTQVPPRHDSRPPPPKPPPSPRPGRRPKKTPPHPPAKAIAALSDEQLVNLTTFLYRSALLGATYARPQIRAIRIFIQKVMDGGPEHLRRVRDVLKGLRAKEHPLVPPSVDVLADLTSLMPYAARLQLVHSIIFLLGCKTLANLERFRDFLVDTAVELKLDPADISLFDLFGITEGEIQLGYQDCLELFGLEEGASEGQIRKAHRKQVRQYHPDQFHSHGAEFVRLAERKMKESNMALEVLLHRADKGI